MEFAFHLSPYDAPFLEEEAARLLAQRLEAHSREAVPGLWKAVDNLNAYAPDAISRLRRCPDCAGHFRSGPRLGGAPDAVPYRCGHDRDCLRYPKLLPYTEKKSPLPARLLPEGGGPPALPAAGR